MRLPEEYHQFLLNLGGAGPGYCLRPLAKTCAFNSSRCKPGHRTVPNPRVLGGHYRDKGSRRDPAPGRDLGTLVVADHGCFSVSLPKSPGKAARAGRPVQAGRQSAASAVDSAGAAKISDSLQY
ncbi:hypothetical protein GCM10010399_67060 [Dactylosporangium fulvum]|uniref:hypothetical protein n=1 Tax=Dactylosporangium fulvum TaxID=53359 RepID=UPI003386D548